MNFSIGRRLRASNDLFWAHERVLTHSVERSKWFEELASESNNIQAQGWINVFVCARAVCGTRECPSGSGNAGPVPGKIHMENIEWDQGC